MSFEIPDKSLVPEYQEYLVMFSFLQHIFLVFNLFLFQEWVCYRFFLRCSFFFIIVFSVDSSRRTGWDLCFIFIFMTHVSQFLQFFFQKMYICIYFKSPVNGNTTYYNLWHTHYEFHYSFKNYFFSHKNFDNLKVRLFKCTLHQCNHWKFRKLPAKTTFTFITTQFCHRNIVISKYIHRWLSFTTNCLLVLTDNQTQCTCPFLHIYA